jgi:hypothetical protein
MQPWKFNDMIRSVARVQWPGKRIEQYPGLLEAYEKAIDHALQTYTPDRRMTLPVYVYQTLKWAGKTFKRNLGVHRRCDRKFASRRREAVEEPDQTPVMDVREALQRADLTRGERRFIDAWLKTGGVATEAAKLLGVCKQGTSATMDKVQNKLRPLLEAYR